MTKKFDPRDKDFKTYVPTEKEIWTEAYESRRRRESGKAGESSIIPPQEMREGYEFDDD